jgi:peptidoglycan LD-endopeptidase LytH
MRMSGWQRSCRALLVGSLLCALVAAPATAAPDGGERVARDEPAGKDAKDAKGAKGAKGAGDAEDDEEEVDPLEEAREAVAEARTALRAATSARAAARAATRGARAAGSSADGSVRVAENDIVPEIVAHRDARERLVEARARLRSLRAALRESRVELEVARDQLEDRVVRAYKQGSIAADTMLPLMVFREAASPGELATAMKDLEVLALTGAATVDELIERITRLEAEIVVAEAARAEAREELEAAGESIELREATAADRRRGAEATETWLLQTIERELAADRAVDAAREVLDEALAELGARPGRAEAGPGEGQGARADFLRGRQRAHDRQRSLDPARRRAADDWVCPVEGSRFVNDWAFPRTQDRRHEGTDVFAPTGTPVVAVVDATVSRMNTHDRFNGRSGFGGITVTYEHGDVRYYNAHLDAIHPAMRVGATVEAGDVIGWVGRTGNARGTPPHLHIGVYVDDVAANPYASLAVACGN